MRNMKTEKPKPKSRAKPRLMPQLQPADETTQALVASLPPTAKPVFGGADRYDPGVGAEVCQRLSLGETLTTICATPGFPTKRSFQRWVVAYPELRAAWVAARRLKATNLFDEALDLARDLKEGRKSVSSNEVNALRVAIDTLRWAASKLDPGQYGDTAGKNPAIAIQINSNLDLGRGVVASEDESLYSFTIKLPSPAEPSTGAEQQRVPASKRRVPGDGSASEESDNG